MSQIQYTVEELSALLIRAFTSRLPRDSRPRVINDVSEKGVPLMELILPHPTSPLHSISLQANEARGQVEVCSLWFGQAEITGALAPDDAIPAIEEILNNNIVAIVRYKNREAYDNHRKSGTAPVQWLYQLPDDEADLTAMMNRLKRPATFTEKLSGKHVGVFEMFRWSGSEVWER